MPRNRINKSLRKKHNINRYLIKMFFKLEGKESIECLIGKHKLVKNNENLRIEKITKYWNFETYKTII